MECRDHQAKRIEDLYRKFQNEQYLLTEEVKKQRIQEIEAKRKRYCIQKEKFGYEGELFQKREELVQNRSRTEVYAAIENWPRNRAMTSSLTRPTAPLYSLLMRRMTEAMMCSASIVTPGECLLVFFVCGLWSEAKQVSDCITDTLHDRCGLYRTCLFLLHNYPLLISICLLRDCSQADEEMNNAGSDLPSIYFSHGVIPDPSDSSSFFRKSPCPPAWAGWLIHSGGVNGNQNKRDSPWWTVIEVLVHSV